MSMVIHILFICVIVYFFISCIDLYERIKKRQRSAIALTVVRVLWTTLLSIYWGVEQYQLVSAPWADNVVAILWIYFYIYLAGAVISGYSLITDMSVNDEGIANVSALGFMIVTILITLKIFAVTLMSLESGV